ncbi:UDP-Glc:alpha-D-GlcNAc-diphosphoundecaprenol beta-1,3-glucosyltransferase WfgD [Zhongshania aliphaticivorans]|uniref:UDP-Glc:alpha-D-GlcNAc-diphosphoundecaprenol beta-1,3-glucosyltransferase WfgD n=1 Tax=Zhongshania aliphaticivorans TaxID=1470434 RepID=A0A5S9Q7Z8_9GAMM|nr:glycosyltransferase family A protein [Zhongshania aliphaticivorans]CAA0087005.1 UDP-Glc:alpha-D-GlcNAc-diphosphoundecaprenol beta-1,3-glucosyltransferase WfgD [Zhongshania aliphaticivorans]CAA0113884.1 UDP-Glc:alpha-D-GlcNAc-diphosphoundecaprenol beta-1,3-glucosyltransferase WfgD [Zhongshania aliphaticivorans]
MDFINNDFANKLQTELDKLTNLPLVSVVIPMYNAAKYLPACLESVLTQTYKNLEIICVDDGSPDNCADIVSSYNDERIKLVKQANRGLAGARNTGIRHANGEFVALLDADDIWFPEKIDAHISHLIANPSIGVSYSGSQFINEEGVDMGIGQYPKNDNIEADEIFCRNPVGNGSAPVLRWEVLKAIKFFRPEQGHTDAMYFDESFRQSEDVECWLRITLSTEWKFEGVNKVLTYYRVNGGGLSANWPKQLAAWERSVENNRGINPEFIAKWEALARAYQYRYLARRAIQSRDARSAKMLSALALKADSGILLRDFSRTAVTLACTLLLSILPKPQYEALERRAMAIAA